MNLSIQRTQFNGDYDEDYVRALEKVVAIAGAWHDAIIMGRFDDIPHKHNQTLNEMTRFIHQWPKEYQRIKEAP